MRVTYGSRVRTPRSLDRVMQGRQTCSLRSHEIYGLTSAIFGGDSDTASTIDYRSQLYDSAPKRMIA